MNRFLNSWWFTFFASVAVLAILIAIAVDLVVISVAGHSLWFPYPK